MVSLFYFHLLLPKRADLIHCICITFYILQPFLAKTPQQTTGHDWLTIIEPIPQTIDSLRLRFIFTRIYFPLWELIS